MAAFDSPKQLVRRARHHTDDLKRQLDTFVRSRPHATFIEDDTKAKEHVYKVRLTGALPTDLPLIVKDAVSNLRDALDHAVYASACDLGAIKPKRTGFPFARDAAGLDGELYKSGRFEDVPPEVRAFLATLQPYEAGNQLLWGLNQIRNTKTHRFLVPLGIAHQVGNISITGGVITGGQIGMYSKWDATKNEIEYMRLAYGSNVQHQVDVTIDILFEDIDVVRGHPAAGTLDAISGEVERVVGAIEAETARLKAAWP